jgi:hypothetical protein
VFEIFAEGAGDAAFEHQVGDQLELIEAFEPRDLGRIAGVDQLHEGAVDQLGDTAAQHHLFAEQVAFAFGGEGRLEDALAAAAERRGVGQAERMGAAGRVLMHAEQAEDALPGLVQVADARPDALGRIEDDVEVRRAAAPVRSAPTGRGRRSGRRRA